MQSAQELMKRFAEMDSNNDGKVDQVEFARGLHMPENSSLAAQLFQYSIIVEFRIICAGYSISTIMEVFILEVRCLLLELKFIEFIAGLSLLNNSSEEGGERSIKLVFQVIDTNGDGES